MLWKDKCKDLLKEALVRRMKMENDLVATDDMIQSRWPSLHSKEGFCTLIVNEFNALAELRMKVEYGDYLAMACNDLKHLQHSQGGHLSWNSHSWQQVAAGLLDEEANARKEEQLGTPIDQRKQQKWGETVQEAAQILGCEERIVRYQIQEMVFENQR